MSMMGAKTDLALRRLGLLLLWLVIGSLGTLLGLAAYFLYHAVRFFH